MPPARIRNRPIATAVPFGMNDLFLGRTPRLTVYFFGLSLGLALLAVGIDEFRVIAIGELSPLLSVLYTTAAIAVGILLSFVFGYLNGGILASWAGGVVPVAGRIGGPLAGGSPRGIAIEFAGALGIGVCIGAVGFAIAIEKHRLDRRTAELPEPPSRAALVGLLALSAVVSGIFLSLFGAIR